MNLIGRQVRSLKAVALIAILTIIGMAGCASSPADRSNVSKEGEIDREWVEEGITDNYIFARGIGAADQTLDNKTQKMATSRNAAIVSAQYNMLSLIKGVKLEGGILVEKAIETDSKLLASINATIKGAQVVRSNWTSDDGCVVTLKLSKKALRDMGLNMPSK